MNRKTRRAISRKIKAGRLIGRDPHTGRFGDLGKVVCAVGICRYGSLTLVARKNGLEWIPDRDVFDSSLVNL